MAPKPGAQKPTAKHKVSPGATRSWLLTTPQNSKTAKMAGFPGVGRGQNLRRVGMAGYAKTTWASPKNELLSNEKIATLLEPT